MKKIITLLFILILCSCAKTDKLKEQQTINKITDKFSYINGVCLRDDVNILFSSFNRGDEIKIIDEDDDYYFINEGSLTLKIQKKFIRTELDASFSEYHAYTKGGSCLYADINGNDVIDTFSLNEDVTIIDEFAGMLLVESNGVKGYMFPSQTSKTLIPAYVAPKAPEINESYEPSWSSGDGGGSSNPSPAPTPESIPQQTGDGEDVVIYNIPKHKVYIIAYSSELSGTVLMDNTESYLTTINRNDDVYILSETDDKYIILVNGYQGIIKKKYVRKENEASYERFEGYTASGASLYSDYEMINRILVFGINETVTIIDEVDGVYVIELNDGTIGYMKKSNISRDKIYIAPRVEIPKKEPIYDAPSGGGGGGGSSNPSPAPSPAPSEWTPEVL